MNIKLTSPISLPKCRLIASPAEAGTECWALSSDTYVKRAIADVTRTLAEVGQQLKSKVITPFEPIKH